ncbi:MAG: hypothetical protein L3K15_07260 [Thermoplasmata archaeon]|nr:hypothetical protein [Thermoplasmata archaeon]
MALALREETKEVAFVTSSQFADGTPDDLLAVPELARRSISVRPAVWDSPTVDWSSFDLIVIRSPWDYPPRVEEFLRWVGDAARKAPMWNPPGMVAWNAHKSYLHDLELRGVPVVPTELARKRTRISLGEILQRRGWNDVVVKPAVSSSSNGLLRVGSDQIREGDRHLNHLLQTGDALVQPFLALAKERGERSLVFFNGEFAFAVGYAFVLENDPRVAQPVTPTPAEIADAGRILATLETPPLYARVDYLPAADGGWLLGELELIEPELLLRGSPTAPSKFADAIEAKLESLRPRSAA